MQTQSARYTIDWGHLIFLAIIGGAVAWYLVDAVSVSMDIHNLLMVGPLCVGALFLCLLIIPQCFKNSGTSERPTRDAMIVAGAAELQTSDKKNLLLIGSVAVSLGLYVCLLDTIGFDIDTWLFALAVMFICGERRPLRLIIYPLLVSLLLISAFRALLPFPMYTVIL